MRVSAVGAIGNGEVRDGMSWGQYEPSARPGITAPAADRVVLSAEAYRTLAGGPGTGALDTPPMPFDLPGHKGTVSMTPGSIPGTVNVRVSLDALAQGAGAGPVARTQLDATVRASWVDAVSRGAAGDSLQAGRVAEALRFVAAIPGQATVQVVSPSLPQAVIIRGPVHPSGDMVWLPAEYPPPADDPALVAQLAPDGRDPA